MRKDIDQATKLLFHLARRLVTPISLNKFDSRKKLEVFHKEPAQELTWIELGEISAAAKK